MNFKNKVVLITGGANGIGKKTAQLFLENDATVVITDFDETAGKDTLEDINHEKLSFYSADVSKETEVEDVINEIIEAKGKIDILINNAGITIDGLLTKMEKSDWDKVISVNLTGVFNTTKAVVPHMLDKQTGVILNASSVVGIYGNIGQTNYSATKAGVIGLTKSWAKEFGPKGIRVNAVAPGFIQTNMTSKVPDKILKLMEEKTPLKKIGKAEDIAHAYLYLASEEAGYVNGTILSVDGGLVV